MNYMGSKSKYVKYIAPIIQKYIDENNITKYIEPFVGGANVIEHIKCKEKIGYDKNKYLIALFKQGQEDLTKIPLNCSREDWDIGKAIYKNEKTDQERKDYEIGAYCFFASYAKGGFARGYAKPTKDRNYYMEGYKSFAKQIPNLKDINFDVKDYTSINPEEYHNCLFYLDPPYQNTKPYGYAFENKFDYDYFWNWVRALSKNNIVLISEQNAPSDFEILWETDAIRTTNTGNDFEAIERLFKMREN